jgi:hypothetical protein
VPKIVACAVVHDDPPEVFVAEDLETLNWVLALKLIAQTPGSDIPSNLRKRLRTAIRAEHWGEAVSLWMEVRPGNIDVYSSYDLHGPPDVVLAAEELQFTPLFRD